MADHAETTLRLRAAMDDPTAMVGLAEWLRLRGRHSEARQWLENAAAATDPTGMTRLGVLLAEEGDLPGAERWLMRGVEAGDASALVSLGAVRRDIVAARRGQRRRKGELVGYLLPRRSVKHDLQDWWQRAAAAGDAVGMFLWSLVCEESGRLEESVRYRRAAADCTDPRLLRTIGEYCRQHGRSDAEHWYDRAVRAEGDVFERGNAAARLAEVVHEDQAETRLREAVATIGPSASGVLAEWLERRGRTDEAEASYRTAAEHGSHRAMNNLGAVLLERAALDEAETWCERAAADGFPEAMSNMAAVHLRRGERQEAMPWLLRAAAAENTPAWEMLRTMSSGEVSAFFAPAVAGDPHAMAAVGTWLAAQEFTIEAEGWLRRAAAAGDPDGMDGLGWMLITAHPGGAREGEAWLLKAVETGSIGACCNLAVVREGQSRNADAEALYERAARAGHVRSMSNLAWLLDCRNDLTAAEHWCRRAADRQDPRAMSNLGWLLERRGDHDEAQQWFHRAAETGDAEAMHNLGAMYGRAGDAHLAQHWYTRAANARSRSS